MSKPNSLRRCGSALSLLSIILGFFLSSALAQAATNQPLELLEADGTTNASFIRLAFSRPLLHSTATEIGNYMVTNLNGATLPLLSVQLLDPTNILLQTASPRLSGNNYLALAHGLQDTNANLINSNNIAPVSTLVTLLSETNFWYVCNPVVLYGDEPDLGTSWRQPNYEPYGPTNYIQWADNEVGSRGVFFFGETNFPGIPGWQLAHSDTPIVYFRTQVSCPGSPLGSSFLFSHLVQDGAVFFLNGPEISRFNMPTGTVTWNTFASSPVEPMWRGPESFLPLQPGTNTICAELHLRPFQFAFTSAVFSARLQAKFDSFAQGPVVFTRQPADQTVWDSRDATFSFQAAGADRFQWYKGSIPIPGETNPVLHIPAVTASLNSNLYSVAAWNGTSSNRSSSARLTVLQDTNPPVLRFAYVVASNLIQVGFSEAIYPPTATNAANYAIGNSGGQTIPIQNATQTDPSNVVLKVVPGTGSGYNLLTRNIVDNSTRHNPLAYPDFIRIGLKLHFPLESSWSYNDSGQNLGSAWRQFGYNAASWPVGQGLFYSGTAPLPGPTNTPLSISANSNSVRTWYFRKRFDLPFHLSWPVVSFRHVIDDGAIFYGNVSEFHRFNMPAGAISYLTPPTNTVSTAQFAGPYSSTFQLVPGENVLAAEVHQSESPGEDICFGAEISINVPSGPIIIVDDWGIHVSRNPTNNALELRWSIGGTLQQTSALQGTNTVWKQVPGAASPYAISPTNTSTFFRLGP